MKHTVKNLTSKAKAVKVKGGHEVVKAGDSVTFDADFSDAQITQYESAGLEFSKAAKAASKTDDAKAYK